MVLIGGFVWTIRSGLRMLITLGLGAGLAVVLVALLGILPGLPTAPTLSLSAIGSALTDATFPTVYGIAAMAGDSRCPEPSVAAPRWLVVVGLVVTQFVTTPVSFDHRICGVRLVRRRCTRHPRRPSRRASRAASCRACRDRPAVGQPGGRRSRRPWFHAVLRSRTTAATTSSALSQTSAAPTCSVLSRINDQELGDERPFSSLRRAVEHEAFVALAARDLGTRTPRVRGFSVAEPNTFVLAYDAVAGRSLDRLQLEEITDEVLLAIWKQIAELRSHRIAHRDLRLANLFLADDGVTWMIDWLHDRCTDSCRRPMSPSWYVVERSSVSNVRLLRSRPCMPTRARKRANGCSPGHSAAQREPH